MPPGTQINMDWTCGIGNVEEQHDPGQTEKADRWIWRSRTHTHTHTKTICLLQVNRSDTDFDVGPLGLHELADDFAELVGIGELPESCRRREGRLRAGRGGHALRGIHVMETAAESGDLLRALRNRNQGGQRNGIR